MKLSNGEIAVNITLVSQRKFVA